MVSLWRPSPYLIKVLQLLTLEFGFSLDVYLCSKNYIFVVVGFGRYIAMVENCMLLSFCMDICVSGVMKNKYVAGDA